MSIKRDKAFWENRWETGVTQWHRMDVHDLLLKYCDQMTNNYSFNYVFIPLCGRSVDLKWLYDKGCHVYAVEIVEKPIHDFMNEYNIEYSIETINDKVKVFKTSDNRLNVYLADFFELSSTFFPPVDAVFDRGALEAMDKVDRKKYVSKMIELIKPTGKMLFSCLEYEGCDGPPHHFSEADVNTLFDESFDVKFLERNDAFDPKIHKEKWGIDWLNNVGYLLTRK